MMGKARMLKYLEYNCLAAVELIALASRLNVERENVIPLF